jgi:hypothetical protein
LTLTLRITKRRALIFGALLALATASAAIAAWIVFTGGSGPAAGKFSTAQQQNAVTFTADSTGVVTTVDPNQDGDLAFLVTNNAGVPETITGASGSFITTPAECASHLSVNSAAFNGKNVVAGANATPMRVQNAVHADASTPFTCSGAEFTVNLTVTTSP